MSSASSITVNSLLLSALAASQTVGAIGTGSDCILFSPTDTVTYISDTSSHGKVVPIQYRGEKFSGVCTQDAASGKTFQISLTLEDGTKYHCILPSYSGIGAQAIWVRDNSYGGDGADSESPPMGRQSVEIFTDPPLSPEQAAANDLAARISANERGSMCSNADCDSALTCLERDTVTPDIVSQVEKNTARLREEIKGLSIKVSSNPSEDGHDEL